jgi:hypothetical protein
MQYASSSRLAIIQPVEMFDRPELFQRFRKIAALGARLGLATGFAMFPALLASWLLPVKWAAVGFVLTAATTWPAYWWVWGKLLKKVGVRV